ncbi:MAG: hypothetical protein U0797_17235 [Gemmataceae bacterium]
MAFSPGGGEVLVVRSGGLVESRDVASGRPTLSRELPLTSVWRTPGTLAAFSGDARVLAGLTATDDRRVCAWEARSGERLAGSFRHAVPAWHVAASADGRLVASAAFGVRGAGLHDEVAVWEPASGGIVMKLDRTNLVTGCLALSPDGNSLARGVGHFTSETSPQGQTKLRLVRVGVEVWCVPGRQPRLELPIGRYAPRGVAFSGDGGLLAACDAGGDVYVWETATGRRLHEEPLRGPAGVEGLAFRPDGRLLAGVNRNEVTIWDLREGLEVIRLRGAPPRPSDGGFSPRVAWSGDGRRLAASNWDQSVTVWDSADLATPDAKGGLRRAAHDRLPRWHLKSAATALGRRRADAVRFHLDQLEKRGELEPAWRLARGDLLGRMGEWEKARREYEAVAPDYGGFPAEVVRARLALMAWKGDRVEYTRLAAALLDGGAAGTVENSAVHTAMACCLFPGAVARPDRLLAPLRELLSPERTQAGLQLALGLASLRAGRTGEAVEAGERALAVSHGEHWVVKTSARIVLALASHRLGRPEDADRHWRKAREEMAEVRERMAAEGLLIAPHIAWWDWLTVQSLEREAESELGRSG